MWFKNKNNNEEVVASKIAWVTIFIITGLTIVFLVAPVAAYNYVYADKVFPGVMVNGESVSGKTYQDLVTYLEEHINNLDSKGYQFVAGGKSISLSSTTVALSDPDLTYDIVHYDSNRIAREAFSYGRSEKLLQNLILQSRGLLEGKDVELHATVSRDQLKKALQENFSELEDTGHNSEIIYVGDVLTFTPEKQGLNLMYDEAIDEFERSLSLASAPTIHIRMQNFVPEISQSVAEMHRGLVEEFLKKNKAVSITYDRFEWKLTPAEYKNNLEFVKNEEGFIDIQFKNDALVAFIEKIAKDVYQEPKDAILKFNEDKTEVVEFIPQQPGQRLESEGLVEKIQESVFKKNEFTIAASVTKADPLVQIGDLNELGIKELLATGTSDYSGSPVNRRHNIGVGAKAFNGVLVPPGEEFSALKNIGVVDATSGYKPELVIKANKTEPEFGGGLCQVSSTMFRAALRAGVEITSRRNHSYTVSYYSPIGTDATIYSPAPDFKFKNDTGHHLLIHTINDTKNSKLYFEIWGTSDGRKVDLTDPVTYDWVAPPPTKIVETLDLKPGVKKCTESAHSGVKAYFDRIITLADGTKNEERFNSNYRPWQAVCLVGVEKLSTEVETPPAESIPTSPDQPTSETTPPSETPIIPIIL